MPRRKNGGPQVFQIDELTTRLLELLVDTGGIDAAAAGQALGYRSGSETSKALINLERKGLCRRVSLFQLTDEGKATVRAFLRLKATFPGKGNHTVVRKRLAEVEEKTADVPEEEPAPTE